MKALQDTGYNGAINFELEDVPGAATPSSAMNSMKMSDEMEEQMALAKTFITDICKELDIPLEGLS